MSAKQAEFGSVGLEVVPVHGGELVVLSVLPGMPAAVGGLKPGDLILTVDGFPLRGSDFSQVVRERLWGRVGSQVTLVFLRPGEEGRRTVVLRRAPLPAAIPEAEGVRILIPGQGAGTQEKKP